MKTTRSAGLGPLIFATALALSCVTSDAIGGERQNSDLIKVNMAALEHAKMLINGGLAVMDGKGDWAQHQPSAEKENEFIRVHGFDEYAKWHLGIDERHAENSKARYKFPYGDFKNVRRSALMAAKSRAQQYRHYEVEKAAIELIQALEKKGADRSQFDSENFVSAANFQRTTPKVFASGFSTLNAQFSLFELDVER